MAKIVAASAAMGVPGSVARAPGEMERSVREKHCGCHRGFTIDTGLTLATGLCSADFCHRRTVQLDRLLIHGTPRKEPCFHTAMDQGLSGVRLLHSIIHTPGRYTINIPTEKARMYDGSGRPLGYLGLGRTDGRTSWGL